MRRAWLAISILLLLLADRSAFCAAARFEKLSDHCYYLQSKGDEANVGAVVTDDGVLLINSPSQSGLAPTLEALRRLTTKPVRWIVGTDYRFARSPICSNFEEQGAVYVESQAMQHTVTAIAEGTAVKNPLAQVTVKESSPPETSVYPVDCPQLFFQNQVRLYPAGVEVLVFALEHKAHSAADVAIFVPGEKVLFVGALFEQGNYPTIDASPGGGSAQGWFDGFRQAIDAVPLLKAAKPQPKIEAKPGEEKSLEELVAVVASRGVSSNLLEMKNLLELSVKLRADVARAARAGRDKDSFLASAAADQYRLYGNLESFVGQLFAEITGK
ncbi:MAG: Zn-dependent hydrolase [Acidobacteria bacterium]|nr:Zn-dependent hydrolase [Acidobacteriota bacterium]